MNKILNKSRGQIAVLYAGILVVLVGAIALGADVSVMYVNWQQAQKVADAATLAGANYLSGGITYSDPATGTPYPVTTGCNGETPGSSPAAVATQVACTYAVKNGLDASTVTISEPSSSTIQVLVQEPTLPYFFGKALGLGTYNVAASATAAAGATPDTILGANTTSISTKSTSGGLFPVGLQCKAPCASGSLVAGESLSFGTKFISTTVNAPGNWDWLGPDGSGASQVGNDVLNGVSASFAVSPDGSCGTNSLGASYCITTATGNKSSSGPLQKDLAARLATCPALSVDPCANGGNPSDIPAGDPCLVIMPIVDFTGVTGSKNIPIESFAEVYLEPDSTAANIDGCFITSVAGGTLALTTTTSSSSTSSTTVSRGVITPPTLSN